MKTRQYFVSNSSSSSFICNVCGEDYIGMDAGLNDSGMFECVSGHTICDSHAVGVIDSDNTEYPYEVSVSHCPICSFKTLEESTALEFLLKEVGKTKKQLLAEIKSKFKNYEEYEEYIK